MYPLIAAAMAKAMNPNLTIIARAHSDEEVANLRRWGADLVVMAEQETAARRGFFYGHGNSLSQSVIDPALQQLIEFAHATPATPAQLAKLGLVGAVHARVVRHPREGGDPARAVESWIPAFAGMTNGYAR